ncbi:hypothetical protein LguiA_015553 [Lonicera macranthoides]
MCISATESEWISSPTLHAPMQKPRSKRPRLRIHGLNSRRKRSNEQEKMDMEKDMEVKNLKLYMENMSILERNEKLRKKAMLLHQENIALMSQLQNKVSQQLHKQE